MKRILLELSTTLCLHRCTGIYVILKDSQNKTKFILDFSPTLSDPQRVDCGNRLAKCGSNFFFLDVGCPITICFGIDAFTGGSSIRS